LAAEITTLLESAVAGDARLRATCDVVEVRHPTTTDRGHPVVVALASAYQCKPGRNSFLFLISLHNFTVLSGSAIKVSSVNPKYKGSYRPYKPDSYRGKL
ncbi:MAG: hypothetical protein MUC31_02400, partial [Bacteroidales bacterium]|nr:hypothetical protein [Bacteroidales bacterium]